VSVEVADLELVDLDRVDVAAYLCPEVYSASTCNFVLGPPPAVEDIHFYARLTLDATNSGDQFIDASGAIVDLLLFPGEAREVAGRTCVDFCRGEVDCDFTPPACPIGQGYEPPFDTFVEGLVAVPAEILSLGWFDADEMLARVTVLGHRGKTLLIPIELDRTSMLDLIHDEVLDGIASAMQGGSIPSVLVPARVEGIVAFGSPGEAKVEERFGPSDQTMELL
jgi:hypothetical protein